MENTFNAFLDTVESKFQKFVIEINDYLTQNNCTCSVKSAKSGYTVAYITERKRTLATFVFRKSGVKLRIYPEHIAEFQDYLNTLPENMKKEIKKASVCKRLINPDDCNPKCVTGYSFLMDGEQYKKCRYMAFMPTLSEENNAFIKKILEKEIAVR